MNKKKLCVVLNTGMILMACGENEDTQEEEDSTEIELQAEEAEEEEVSEEEPVEELQEQEDDELAEYEGYFLFEEDNMHVVVHINEEYVGEYWLPQGDSGSTLWTIIEKEELDLTGDTYKAMGSMLDTANYQEWENPHTPTSIEETTVEYSLTELDEARVDPEELRETTSDNFSDPVDIFARLYEEFYLPISEEHLIKEEAVENLWGEYVYESPEGEGQVTLILQPVEETEEVSPTYEMTGEELEEEGVIGFYESVEEDGVYHPATYLEAVEFVSDTNEYYIHSRVDVGTGRQDPLVYTLEGNTLTSEYGMSYERVQE